jgi:immune inhibitor A
MTRIALLIPALVLVACGDDPVQPENVRPISSFSYECVELTCSFTNLSSDEEGPLITNIFDFGDGTETATADPTHTYHIGGAYTVTLVVQDLDGAKVESEQNIRVNSPPNVAISSPTEDLTFFDFGAPVTFEAMGTDRESDVLSYAWFLVESGKLTPLSNAAIFTTSDLSSGIHLIQVTATDADGSTASAAIEVEIGDPAP